MTRFPVVLLILSLCTLPAMAQTRAWSPVGLSGGGAMFAPAISPADPNRMMLNCDMSAAYVTADGGMSWRMIHYAQLDSNTRCRPAFHPTDANTIFAADGGGGMKVSHDGGVRWEAIGNLPGGLQGEIAIDSDDPRRMLCGASNRVYRSNDGGKTWTACEEITGTPLGFHFDLNSPKDRRNLFAGTAAGIWRSRDGGESWAKAVNGLPDRPVLSFAGGSNKATTLLYCSVPSEAVNGKFAGGVYVSRDRGDSWRPVGGEGLNRETKAFDQWSMGSIAQYAHVATTDARPETVYTVNSSTGVPPPHHATVFRSDDAGRTWRATFQGDPRFPGLNVERDYTVVEEGQYFQGVPEIAVNPRSPDDVIRVDMGGCYISRDGGRTWKCGHTHAIVPVGAKPAPGAWWLCNGLVVTTTWNYYIDPFRPRRHYICYTDIGFAISNDAGKTWSWWGRKGRAPWNNTCYELAFDPAKPGRIWGAFSNVHDIPNGNIIYGNHSASYPGGVCVSDDSGETWKPCTNGLPTAATTSIVVDPKSPADSRTLYAGVFGKGVFRSTDGGRSWAACNSGLSSANLRVCRVALHSDGTLFALVTANRVDRRFQPEGVGLYRSTDRGASWSPVNGSNPLLWPKDFTVDPADSKRIYLSACNANGREEGGLYRTTDGGATWTRLAQKGPEHFGAYLHPKRPGWIYMTLTESAPGAGLWLSRDDGKTWAAMDGLPFGNAQRVVVDPADPDSIYVTTFGGSVWHGPAAPQASSIPPDPAAWKTFPNALQPGPVRRITDSLPLSDQKNATGWMRYAPLTDEFNSTALDSAKWNPTNPTWKGRQPAFFSPKNVTESGGMLHLTMRKEDPPADLKPQGYHDYSSAAVQSKDLVRYGYFEVRARPMRSGGSSAFWFYHGTPEWWTEIDVFEIGGRAPSFERKLNITMHVMHTPTSKEHWSVGDAWIAPADLDADFHVYGLEWDAKEIKVFFDGRLVRCGPNTHWHQPLTLNFDSETMPEWWGLPKDSDLPSTYDIDYVRVWKRRGDQ